MLGAATLSLGQKEFFLSCLNHSAYLINIEWIIKKKSNTTTRIGISLTIEYHKDKTEAKCSASMKSSQYEGICINITYANNDVSLYAI